MDFLIAWFLNGKMSHVLCKNNSVRKIDDRLFKTLVSALPYGIDWVDVPSPSVVSGVTNMIKLIF